MMKISIRPHRSDPVGKTQWIVLTWDGTGVLRNWSSAAPDALGCAPRLALGRHARAQPYWDEVTGAAVGSVVQALWTRPRREVDVNVRLNLPDGEVRKARGSVFALPSPAGDAERVVMALAVPLAEHAAT